MESTNVNELLRLILAEAEICLRISLGSPNGNRTRVFGVRGRYPRPLDDGTIVAGGQGFEPWFAGPEPAVLPLNDPPVSLI
jgi:hypothetical protein